MGTERTNRMTDGVDIAVIGGGSTGCGVVRDAASRGLDAVLVEQGNLTHGTTGRMHGLLHSGARYAVSDPRSARESIRENLILRDVAAHCIEDTGGLFVKRPENDETYFHRKIDACHACDIPAEVLSGEEVRTREPYLADDVDKAIAVPDAAIDPFRLCVANAADAQAHGARIETHAEVIDVLVEEGAVVGVEIEHGTGPAKRSRRQTGETERIYAKHVVNATGAWAGHIGEMAGVDVRVRPSKGAMVVTNVRQVDTVINWCRPKGDADIIVPHETTCILGTTDVEVGDPGNYPEHRWEVEVLIDELSKLVPALADARTLRSFWGVRPLYEPPERDTADTTDITRQHFILDHGDRDGRPGMTSIVGGKLTTYRLMAEEVVDHVCEELRVAAVCTTADEPLPGSSDFTVLRDHMDAFGLRSPIGRRSSERLGSRAAEVLSSVEPNPVVCACEAVTRAEVRDAIDDAGADLNAVRIRTRSSMGNCQGCFCAHRMASELVPQFDAETARLALDELHQERWKGQRHSLWGEQLSQVMLTHMLHATTMNRDGDPAMLDDDVDFDAFDAGGERTRSTVEEGTRPPTEGGNS